MLVHVARNSAQLGPPKPAAACEPHWLKPEFGDARVPFHVNVRWLSAVAGIEEEPIGTRSEDGRHALPSPANGGSGLAQSGRGGNVGHIHVDSS